MWKVRNCRQCHKLYCPMRAKGADRSRCYRCQRTPEQAERDQRNYDMMRGLWQQFGTALRKVRGN